ncbi:hemagglutinin/amebocyte aggregation factor-like [Dendronephthya gigantea]|uniref:hemagglutinin/amebocyte aggregation factor-like n=1 Tax=Dendronephthya gigantea TaxID=151771 RepID=UPI00106962CF|nr:hemagglutinin/amebocyte aggregation factor-like [Dendronephthya gigantea]
MMKVALPLASLLILMNFMVINAGTSFDAQWTRTCEGPGKSISGITSFHSNHHEDRSWSFQCRHNRKITPSCVWSGWVNSYDNELLFQCPYKGVISGVHSKHNNHHEDRLFDFLCCSTKAKWLSNCRWTGYVNTWDGSMNYVVPWNYVLVGAKSHHNNRREDRIWQYRVCELV